MHVSTHRARPNEVDSVNQAPAIKTEDGRFSCRFCNFIATRKYHYNRHTKNAHLRQVADVKHHGELWKYAQKKKAPGTAYYEAKRRREEAALQEEIQTMQVVMMGGAGNDQIEEQPSTSFAQQQSAVTTATQFITKPIVGVDQKVVGGGEKSYVTVVDENRELVGYLAGP